MTTPREDRAQLRSRLLPLTIDHAVQAVPAYAETLADFVGSISAPEDLARLPLVTKADIMADPQRYRDAAVPTALVQHTGGTSGQTLFVHRGAPELAFIKEFFDAVDGGSNGDAPLCVSLTWNRHGDLVPIPYPGPVLAISLDDPYWSVESLISAPWSLLGVDQRPAVLTGLESQLRRLTCSLVEAGYDFERSSITQLHSTGDYITSRLRHWYETTWDAPLVNRWSMTEIFGGASECHLCGCWHLDPYLVGEVVDPVTRAVTTSGYGILVVSCLYPFVQKQPLLRYWTGDLAEVGPTTCEVDSFAWTFKGRAALSIVEATEAGIELLLSAADLYDLLDDFPDIASSRMFVDDRLADHSALGHLKIRLERRTTEADEIRLVYETRYCAYMYPGRALELSTRIRSVVLARHPDLQRAVESGRMSFSVVPALPNTLSSFMPDETE